MNITAYQLAERFIGVKEIPGSKDNPMVLSMLRLDAKWPRGDEVPWCSAFVNYICWLLRLPRSKSLRARSWLQVGLPLIDQPPERGFDVVILSRGPMPQPGPDVINAPGHVGFFTEGMGDDVWLLGGNQRDSVSVARYPSDRIIGIRRLA